MSGESRLARVWYARPPTPAARLLRPLSFVFGAIAAARRALYRAHVLERARVPVPVIVVGNITAGGSGKTPLVAALCDGLARRGCHPGIVSRGYGRRGRDTREVRTNDDPRDVGDEPRLLAALGVPVWIGRDRVAAARALAAAHPGVDVIVADDGLQHYRLARDVEIAVVDAASALGNGLLLPAGPLREPAARLAGVDAVVWRADGNAERTHRYNAREFAMTYESLPFVNLRDPSRVLGTGPLTDKASVAIAGIAQPQRFFDALRARGFIGATRAFADHHFYRRDDVSFPGAGAILMTEKDAVKCRAFADDRMWMLPIRARIDPALVDFVLGRIDGPEAARNAGLPGDQGAAHL